MQISSHGRTKTLCLASHRWNITSNDILKFVLHLGCRFRASAVRLSWAWWWIHKSYSGKLRCLPALLFWKINWISNLIYGPDGSKNSRPSFLWRSFKTSDTKDLFWWLAYLVVGVAVGLRLAWLAYHWELLGSHSATTLTFSRKPPVLNV